MHYNEFIARMFTLEKRQLNKNKLNFFVFYFQLNK